MSEYKLSDRIRSGTDIMQRIVGGQRPALIELADEVAILEDALQTVEDHGLLATANRLEAKLELMEQTLRLIRTIINAPGVIEE